MGSAAIVGRCVRPCCQKIFNVTLFNSSGKELNVLAFYEQKPMPSLPCAFELRRHQGDVSEILTIAETQDSELRNVKLALPLSL